MPSRLVYCLVPLAAIAGVAIIGAQPSESDAAGGVLDNQRLGELIGERFAEYEVEGQPGFWRVDLSKGGKKAKPGANGKPRDNADDQDDGEQDGGEKGPGADGHVPPVVLVLTDEQADRMRIMMPIRPFNPEQAEDLRLALIALHANYDRALDARYAVQEGLLWSVFIHPLGSLTPADLTNAFEQVQALRENTGTTYSSSELFFGGGEGGGEGQPAGPDGDPDDLI